LKKYVNLDGITSINFTKVFTEVEFDNGTIRKYHKVPYGTYSDFLNAGSKTTFLKLVMKQYEYTLVK